jgi:CSLREA domain-containing protein
MLTCLRTFATLVMMALAAPPAFAATFTVTSAADLGDAAVGNGVCATSEGQCTLRAALQEANATPAPDTVAFAIGTGPQRITVGTALPSITAPIVIDGWTQPGFSSVPLIEIRGSLFSGDGLRVTGGSSTLRGLVINGFGGDGVVLSILGHNVVEGCYIGTSADGMQAVRNIGPGIRIDSYQNRIGGLTTAQRNVISGNGGFGIEGGILIYGETAIGNVVQGNFIGLDAAGLNPIGNLGRGVAIHFASYNLIGGSEPGAGNLIAGNRASGVRIMSNSTGNIVWKNWIGINKLGQMRVGTYPEPGTLSNARGVQIRGDGNYVIDNVIAGNTEDGVLFYDGTLKDLIPMGYARNNLIQGNYIIQNGFSGIGVYVGESNRFSRNKIFGNGHLGINLEDRTFGLVTLNDPDDSDLGTNGSQNFPVVASATVVNNQTSIQGTLTSRPSGSYTIEISASPACSAYGHGEGWQPIAETVVTTSTTGASAFTVSLPFAVPKGWGITATATDSLGSTSEYSACAVVR